MTAKPGRGRPAIGRPIQVRFPPDTRAALDEIAAARGQSVAQVVRDLCDQAIHASPDT